jgi:hypothetical protein
MSNYYNLIRISFPNRIASVLKSLWRKASSILHKDIFEIKISGITHPEIEQLSLEDGIRHLEIERPTHERKASGVAKLNYRRIERKASGIRK